LLESECVEYHRPINNFFVSLNGRNAFLFHKILGFIPLSNVFTSSPLSIFAFATWFFLCQQHTVGVRFSSQSSLQSRFFTESSFGPRKRVLLLPRHYSRIHNQAKKEVEYTPFRTRYLVLSLSSLVSKFETSSRQDF